MIVKEFCELFEQIAPISYAEQWDNVGLLVGRIDKRVQTVLVALDITTSVVEYAKTNAVDLIVCHHPIIFGHIATVIDDTPNKKLVIKLLQMDIAVFVAHTNLDYVEGGINDYLANLMRLINIMPIDCKHVDCYNADNKNTIKDEKSIETTPRTGQNPLNKGNGRIGQLSIACKASQYKDRVATILNDQHVKLIGDGQKTLAKIAVYNGSCCDNAIEKSLQLGADCIVSSEIKYHLQLQALETGIVLIEASHYNTEEPYMLELAKKLQELLKDKGVTVKLYKK